MSNYTLEENTKVNIGESTSSKYTIEDGKVIVKNSPMDTLTEEQKEEVNKLIQAEIDKISARFTLASEFFAENAEVDPVEEIEAAAIFEQFDEMIAFTEIHEGIGLSASQIGITKAYFVYHSEDGRWKLIFNPKYYQMGDGRETYNEGCLTYPGKVIPVKRYKVITAQYQTWDGEKFERVRKTMRGLEAVIFQHESNHCGFPLTGGKAKSITIMTRQ